MDEDNDEACTCPRCCGLNMMQQLAEQLVDQVAAVPGRGPVFGAGFEDEDELLVIMLGYIARRVALREIASEIAEGAGRG